MIEIGFAAYADGTSELTIEDTTIPETINLELKLNDEQIKKLQTIVGMCVMQPAKKRESH